MFIWPYRNVETKITNENYQRNLPWITVLPSPTTNIRPVRRHGVPLRLCRHIAMARPSPTKSQPRIRAMASRSRCLKGTRSSDPVPLAVLHRQPHTTHQTIHPSRPLKTLRQSKNTPNRLNNIPRHTTSHRRPTTSNNTTSNTSRISNLSANRPAHNKNCKQR